MAYRRKRLSENAVLYLAGALNPKTGEIHNLGRNIDRFYEVLDDSVRIGDGTPVLQPLARVLNMTELARFVRGQAAQKRNGRQMPEGTLYDAVTAIMAYDPQNDEVPAELKAEFEKQDPFDPKTLQARLVFAERDLPENYLTKVFPFFVEREPVVYKDRAVYRADLVLGEGIRRTTRARPKKLNPKEGADLINRTLAKLRGYTPPEEIGAAEAQEKARQTAEWKRENRKPVWARQVSLF